MNKFKILVLASSLYFTLELQAACFVRNSNGQVTSEKGDALFAVLQAAGDCPQNVQQLKAAINQTGLTTQPYMVANRGVHNPVLGSFSFFEHVSGLDILNNNTVSGGEFFFGHFTTAKNGLVIADQEPKQGQLLIELIAWDKTKELFNFYELIGTGQGGQWFYRGDSKDILADNAKLHLNLPGPQFGSTLRCSACHTSGGPIMKEVSAPFNDWWTIKRPLTLAPNKASSEIANWINQLGDASELSQSVQAGIKLLEASPAYQKAKSESSFQALLRPLFCEVEINLESDLLPFNERISKHTDLIQIPSASIANPILAQAQIEIDASVYAELLESVDMRFPETGLRDADHAWLVPVKGYSDLEAIQSLIQSGTITQEFAADVLAVDFQNPLFSAKRCGLLQLLPPDGLAHFTEQLKQSDLLEAQELFENLTNASLTKNYHMSKAQEFLTKTQANLKIGTGQQSLFKKMMNNRQAVFNSDISKNPRGQILEPGFRVIFPTPHLKN